MIMEQVKRVLAKLTDEEKAQMAVFAVTLDPERDNQKALKGMAEAQGVKAPLFNFVTGDPKIVNRVLDEFNIVRKKDPKTGIIDHVNLFILIDKQNRIAYRFALGDTQEKWMIKALKILINETPIKGDS